MKRRTVRWAEPAIADLESITSYVHIKSPAAASKTWKRIRTAASRLETMQSRGRVVPELLRLGIRDYRELVISPYRVVYRITGNVILVSAVLDSRRDLEDILLERLSRSD